MESKGIVVNYHYVNDRCDDFHQNIKKTNTSQFKRQVEFLMEKYQIICPTMLERFFYQREKLPDNFCVLTFDDGLKDHYANVFPILKNYNIKACFAVPTAIFEKEEILLAHKNHILLAKLGEEQLVAEINKKLENFFPELLEKYKIKNSKMENVSEPELLRIKYMRDSILTANLKYLLATMPTAVKTKILNDVFKDYFTNESKLFQEFYLNREEIKEMVSAGMVFAGHGCGHVNLSSIDRHEQEKEINLSREIFKREFGFDLENFSYPYGGYNEETIKLLKENNFKCAFTVKKEFVQRMGSPFEINRYSTMDFPFA